MKLLITGAQGQVGAELVRIASQHDHDVIAASRSELDVTNKKNVIECITQHHPDIVINAAAYTAVDKAEEEIDTAYAINHTGAENLALACTELNIPLFHISTDYVFDGSKTTSYSEDDDISPLGVYGKSKWAGEESIRKQMDQFIILRVAWVFGAQGNNFVKTMLRLGRERDELGIVADQFGGPTPAVAIAGTLIYLAELYQKENTLKWGTYHYCGTSKTSWYEFAKEIFHQAHNTGLLNKEPNINSITTSEYPTPAKRPINSMLDCTRINNTFGIKMPE
ncbi:MAG: dTDP-4-dehydrorhamnose reductase, partial [Gammaproteobacteria bacterium]|nr:dTDP-4-dehydrorhamnose reductase [Gammaproteobacteria bacterium]